MIAHKKLFYIHINTTKLIEPNQLPIAEYLPRIMTFDSSLLLYTDTLSCCRH